MKIQIVANENVEEISGYKKLLIDDFLNSKDIMNNQCTDIIVDTVISRVDYTQFKNLMMTLVSKLRLDGKIYIKDINCKMLFFKFTSGQMEIDYFNQLMANITSYYSYSDVIKFFNSVKITVDTLELQGLEYEIWATRRV